MAQSVKNKIKVGCKAIDYEQCQHFINAFNIIGKKWNGLIISSLCDGEYMRFKDLASCVEACSDRVLVERLKELERENIIKRLVDEKTKIISYSLTKKGEELRPVFDQIHGWADKWE
ncbi:transcriptional regulator, HxlR family [Lactobacillus bombicola]|jgi:DNA-binding HxlR family transcriptional regulator|uniref:Transcriptional regulator n=1 Tax=Lactobacillus bombicola TaxID=1505723 RepID=A0A1I1SGG3_9LACO|nr:MULTISPECIES: helix-turn-helix domain-containing protein [Lactobacillus]MCO6527998.1 helix-turn-helix transcriptional regulator [Lactobacillus sp.]RHW52718.1 transcriptional regulator [Lactobacillus bombicola]RHW53119.1 transcriptional regulator [Lactobacillus bombicola]RMC39129.1 transcriptional regulator [Lactobacillus sp. ESL0237]RMC41787.1 transcriptional regulator [Lactobacillus sp. ESL0233]